MAKELNLDKQKKQTTNKSLYIEQDLADKIDEIAKKNNTSFNHVVVSIIRQFFEED